MIINYLDDYLFAAALKSSCDEQVYVFLGVCQKINFQVAMEKTHWGCTQLTFLGMLLDTERQIVGIPLEKIAKALELIRFFLGRSKVTMLQFQKLCGFLNFLCRAIVPGRVFVCRLYAKTSSKLSVPGK